MAINKNEEEADYNDNIGDDYGNGVGAKYFQRANN